ncbi:apolipoprotein N-acyltransferase [Pseudoalteromonas sp. Of7M-16]|uniref:apolipoprotein N-acyltransferase n=1 Tax=Pseudoalteromonas sp. Of7M-16 TaxID=2917756 RepID=UPI001EF4C617|nr:apolipoprotein N-acyltransferase [Pseudoalteromonas sp. Of7M-16]MCG7551320.1 apolipoprotein N-acyltransferase [Pseudoalteromonas sp. Of7M-16]
MFAIQFLPSLVCRTRLVKSQVYLLAGSSGCISALSFAPYNLYYLAFYGPIICFLLWERVSIKKAFVTGFLYTATLLSVAGTWLYLSPNQLADMPMPLAILVTVLVIAAVSLCMGAAGAIYVLLKGRALLTRACLLFPSLWWLAEWSREWFLSGYPWFNIGYSQLDMPLIGWASVFGVNGIAYLVAMSSALVTIALFYTRYRLIAMSITTIAWTSGMLLQSISWTKEVGSPIPIALVQPNHIYSALSNKDKWQRAVELNRQLLSKHQLIVWPETEFSMHAVAPQPSHITELDKHIWQTVSFSLNDTVLPFATSSAQYRGFVAQLETITAPQNKSVLMGTNIRDHQNNLTYNSVLAVNATDKAIYDKRHLVPFGETIPLRQSLAPLWQLLNVHQDTFNASRTPSPLLPTSEYLAGVSICYEAAFGSEVADALPGAHFLVMLTNDGMFDGTSQPEQHLQIARMRAIETGRWVARAARTGITAFIAPDAAVIKRTSHQEFAILSSTIAPLQGSTPFVYWRNTPFLLFTLAVIGWFALNRR